MPKSIVIAGASSKVGNLLIPMLAAEGHSVTALMRAPKPIGRVVETVENWMANPHAVEVISKADVVVNLTGDINPKGRSGYFDANVQPAQRLAKARAGNPAEISIMIGWAGSDPNSRNAFHRAKLQAEAATRQTGKIATIFHPSSVMGTPEHPWDFEQGLSAPAGKSAQAFGTGKVRMRPVLGEDLAKLIVQAIDHPQAGVFAAQGPDEMTLDGYVRLVNQDADKPITHAPGWLAMLIAPMIGMQRDMVRLFLRDALDSNPDAFGAFGVTPTSVVAAWAPKLGRKPGLAQTSVAAVPGTSI